MKRTTVRQGPGHPRPYWRQLAVLQHCAKRVQEQGCAAFAVVRIDGPNPENDEGYAFIADDATDDDLKRMRDTLEHLVLTVREAEAARAASKGSLD